MGRAGRYTLSVMVFVAAFAAWTNVVGLVAAAIVRKPPSANVSSGVTSVMYVVLSSVPTIAALWFNDWARDGFPSAKERRHGDYRRADPTLSDLPAQSAASAQPPSDAR
ncbi:MAG: hypothetical protein QOG49_1323 [Frankiaceae bacterium]|nr:hypothetical protein [Frankiaceae bacterium]